MHELSITESVLDICEKHALASGAEKVIGVNLIIGQLSSIVDDSVVFYWEIISKGSICEGSTLHFSRIPALLKCNSCEETYSISDEMTPCPFCNSIDMTILQGEEFRVESIDVETEPELS